MPNKHIPKTITENRVRNTRYRYIYRRGSMQEKVRKRGREREQYKERKREKTK